MESSLIEDQTGLKYIPKELLTKELIHAAIIHEKLTSDTKKDTCSLPDNNSSDLSALIYDQTGIKIRQN